LKWRWLAVIGGVAAALLVALWLARATIAAQFARNYFRAHGVNASVEIGALGLAGVSGRFALGPSAAPEFSAENIELHFDPLRWTPFVTEVRLVNPVVRARVLDDGSVSLGTLETWLKSLQQRAGSSSFVSDDLVVSMTGLRALLTTPAGAAEVDGDIRLVKNQPASAALTLRSGSFVWAGITARMKAGQLHYDRSTGAVTLHVTTDLTGKDLVLKDLDADLKADGLNWSSAKGLSVSLRSADLVLSATGFNQGKGLALHGLKASLRAVGLSWSSPGGLSLTSADLAVSAADGAEAAVIRLAIANLSATPKTAKAEMRLTGGLLAGPLMPRFKTGDARLDRVLAANLAHLKVAGSAAVTLQDGHATVNFTTPVEIAGARGGALTVQALQLAASRDGFSSNGFRATLHGGGLPEASAEVKDLVWSGGGLTAHARFATDFDYAMLKRAHLDGAGIISWQSGRYGFTPAGCANIKLAAFHPGDSDLAKDIQTELCGTGPLLAGEGAHWRLTAQAKQAAAFLPLANSRIDQADAALSFEGVGGDFHGQATVNSGRASDKTVPVRFKPVLGKGTVALARGVWRGQLAVTTEKNQPLGDVSFTHTMAGGAGTAHIAAPHLSFALDKLQPEDLSPLLAAYRRSEGSLDFQGDIAWTRDRLTSRGALTINALDYLTPLGRAHAVSTRLDFTSLLPPQTAPGQHLTISQIDWTLPFTAVDLRFALSPQSLKVDALSSGWAEGRAFIMPFAVNLADPGKIAGAAVFQSISLQSLITASNLNGKAEVAGKISGHIPFAAGPDGIRITHGSLAADGPGRLSVNRSLFMQGDAAINSNAVQDFAYQALENLSFESLTADLDSVANGRLRIVFHIKGKFDPPKPQTADVAISDILNGTALYKPISLPSGTPVDLTLDTSLNFDELLKSYAEAWSKMLKPAPVANGAKP
jgi:hypothetical protein